MKSNYLLEDLSAIASYAAEQKLSGHTLLVTGATGLIGSLLIKGMVAHNQQGGAPIRVVALARNPEKVAAVFAEEMAGGEIPHVQFVYQDISMPLPEGLACDYIIHTANSTTSKYFMTNPVEVMESIYTGTKNILEYGRMHLVKGIVYLSSMEVFGRVDTDQRIGEQQLGYLDIQNVRSCYSEGKRLAELMCKSYAQEYQVPVRVARLAQTFGAGVPAGENRVFAQFARSAIRGEDIVLHTMGRSTGNYCYTADVVRALLLLLNQGESGESYTVVNEETTRTIAEMAQMVAETFSQGKSKVVFDIPEGNTFGYAPDSKMRLSAKKLNDLGWQAKYGLTEMYRRMLPDL